MLIIMTQMTFTSTKTECDITAILRKGVRGYGSLRIILKLRILLNN